MEKTCRNCGTPITKEYCEDYPVVCEHWTSKKTQTNADRIRSMSDEELAKVLNAFAAYFEECNRSESEVDCKDCPLNNLCGLHEGKALEWLQQPAEG